jgi:hypothetical protein
MLPCVLFSLLGLLQNFARKTSETGSNESVSQSINQSVLHDAAPASPHRLPPMLQYGTIVVAPEILSANLGRPASCLLVSS